jgi:hypothetical protein
MASDHLLVRRLYLHLCQLLLGVLGSMEDFHEDATGSAARAIGPQHDHGERCI